MLICYKRLFGLALSKKVEYVKAFNYFFLSINLWIFHKKYPCEEDGKKFNTYEELIDHAREIHHHPIIKCNTCGNNFFMKKIVIV
jgi:hypothetical protein